MKPLYLKAQNFLCYQNIELDLSTIVAALILGQSYDTTDISNGVGKSTIFRAIEYVLFNQARDTNLENLIQDDAKFCKVVLDFVINDKIWRVSRTRTKKGIADLSLYERTAYQDQIDPHALDSKDDNFKLYWEDKSSRRAPDTEADLEKILKINYKAFDSAFVFAQNDFNSGLANATPSKRRQLFKESLPMAIYAKLEKLAKTKSDQLLKEIERKTTLKDNFGDLVAANQKFNENLTALSQDLLTHQISSTNQEQIIEDIKNQINTINLQINTIKSQTLSAIESRKLATDRVSRLKSNYLATSQKKKDLLEEANFLAEELKTLKLNLNSLQLKPDLKLLKEQTSQLRDKTTEYTLNIKTLKAEITELQLPLPTDAVCRHCRQELSPEHRQNCQNLIDQEISVKQIQLNELNQLLNSTNFSLKAKLQELQISEENEKKYQSISNQISNKDKELLAKKALFQDYQKILAQQKEELILAEDELTKAQSEVDQSSEAKLTDLNSQLVNLTESLKLAQNKSFAINQKLTNIQSQISIINHSIQQNQENITKKDQLIKQLSLLEEEYSIYPDVIQAFSSTGIPNLIIHNLLDDLQTEANLILNQIKPGLQLEFSVVKDNKEQSEDLDIKYYYNNKPRCFGTISGAMKLSVMFGLKLGFASLLYKTLGTNIRLLMLDEVDMPLDKYSTDAFAEIIKILQKEFTILVITHDDRLKDKFNQIILVEQDQHMISHVRLLN